MDISELVGLTLTKIDVNDEQDEMLFHTECGKRFRMWHDQDCCETVDIDDIVGDLEDLIGTPVVYASSPSSSDGAKDPRYDESFTWTFYKIDTVKGGVTIKWYGCSNGYYSEEVSFMRDDAPNFTH